MLASSQTRHHNAQQLLISQDVFYVVTFNSGPGSTLSSALRGLEMLGLNEDGVKKVVSS
jgi:hypothetical protein